MLLSNPSFVMNLQFKRDVMALTEELAFHALQQAQATRSEWTKYFKKDHTLLPLSRENISDAPTAHAAGDGVTFTTHCGMLPRVHYVWLPLSAAVKRGPTDHFSVALPRPPGSKIKGHVILTAYGGYCRNSLAIFAAVVLWIICFSQ